MRHYFIILGFLVSFILCFTTGIQAQPTSDASNNAVNSINSSNNSSAGAMEAAPNNTNAVTNPHQKLVVYCPKVDELVRNPDTLKWEGKNPTLWEGYEMSFEEKLDHFVGAQWHGTNIGQLFCVYHSARKVSFPILILVHALVFEPGEGKWSKNLGDYRNCVTSNQQDCPFTPQQPSKEQNPYQQLQNMKNAPSQQELGY